MTREELKKLAMEKSARSAALGGYVPPHWAAVETTGDGPWRLQWCYGDDAAAVNEEARLLACHNRQFGRSGCDVTVTPDL